MDINVSTTAKSNNDESYWLLKYLGLPLREKPNKIEVSVEELMARKALLLNLKKNQNLAQDNIIAVLTAVGRWLYEKIWAMSYLF